jgi:hypothetical protein
MKPAAPTVMWVLLSVCAVGADDAGQIVRHSISLDQSNWDRAKDYTFLRRVESREMDAGGRTKAIHSDTYDVTILYGRPYERLIERDGKPLAGNQAAREQEKLDKTLAERRKESEDENGRRRREYEERRRKNREFLKQLPEAYQFSLAGEGRVDGHDAWIIAADPKPGYQPHDRITSLMPKIRGRVWIDKAQYQWVKMEAETVDTITFGLFLARLGPGAHMTFEQRRLNDEIWLPSRAGFEGEARLALLKKARAGVEITYKDYRKFQTDSRVVSGDGTQ